MKVVINKAAGGFALSQKAYEWLIDNGMPLSEYPNEAGFGEYGVIKGCDGSFYDTYFWSNNRTDPLLVGAVEFLQEDASGKYSKLHVIEIPEDVEFTIERNEYGIEWIAEKHRTWE